MGEDTSDGSREVSGAAPISFTDSKGVDGSGVVVWEGVDGPGVAVWNVGGGPPRRAMSSLAEYS